MNFIRSGLVFRRSLSGLDDLKKFVKINICQESQSSKNAVTTTPQSNKGQKEVSKDGKVPAVDPPPTSATSCTPSVIEGITGGRTDICLYTGPPPCVVQECKTDPWSVDAIAPHEDASPDPPPDVNVIVIGAGLAGLSAASHLVKNRIVNTTVLEASPRPGGRIRSACLNGKVVELGAPCPAAEHRQCNCPVTALATKLGFMQLGDRDRTNGLLANCDGTERPLPVLMTAFNEFIRIREELKCIRFPPGEEDELFQSYLKIRLSHLMANLPEEFMEDAIRTIAGLQSMVSTPEFVSDSVACYTVVGGVKVPMGHISLVAPYLEVIGVDRIQYNKKVTKIKWGTVTKEQRPRAVIQCADGHSYDADYVIVAIPLGVLKADMDSLFCPALPASKTNAISKMCVISQEVMYLSWPQPLWVWREEPLSRIWTEEDMECREGWLKSIRSVQEVASSDNLLKITLEGPETELFSKMSDMEVICGITEFLKQWQGDTRIPTPLFMLRSSWGTDRHFKGSLPKANCPEVEKQLIESVPCGCGEDPTIFFAGDGTAPNACGTIGGAVISGFREADRIVNIVLDAHKPQQHPCFVKCCAKAPNSISTC